MRQSLTLQTLEEQLEYENENKTDYLVHTENMSVVEGFFEEGPYWLSFKNKKGQEKAFELTSYSLGQIAAYIKVPVRLIYVLSNGTVGERKVLGQLITERLRSHNEKRMVRTLAPRTGDRVARAFLSDRYRVIDNWDLYRTIAPNHGDKLVSADLSDTHMYMKFVNPELSAEIGKVKKGKKEVGDIIQAGVTVVNSEVGASKMQSDAFIYKLSCLNGAIVKQTTSTNGQVHLGSSLELEDEDWGEFVVPVERAEANMELFLKVLANMDGMFSNRAWFDDLATRFMVSKDHKISGSPATLMGELSKIYNLSQEESKSILKILLKESDLTMFGVINAITSFAKDTHKRMTYARATELEAVGGNMLHMPPSIWERISNIAEPKAKTAKATKKK